jgi:hypothetical protein
MKICVVILFLLQHLGSTPHVANGEEPSKDISLDMTLKAVFDNKRILPNDKGSSCTMCWNGAPFKYKDAIVPRDFYFANVTCSLIDSFLQAHVNPSEPACYNFSQSYGPVCGCPSCPGICPNGEQLSYPDRIVPYDLNGDGIFNDTCSDLNMLVKSAPNGNEACYRASFASEYCGCKMYKPKVCIPCYNNDAMPNFTVVLSDNSTCADSAFKSLNSLQSNTFECESSQTRAALFCNCPSIAPSYFSSCTLCYANETLSQSSEPVVGPSTCNYLNQLSMFDGSILQSHNCVLRDLFTFYLYFTPNERATCCTPKSPTKSKGKKGGVKATKKQIQAAEAELMTKISLVKKKISSRM